MDEVLWVTYNRVALLQSAELGRLFLGNDFEDSSVAHHLHRLAGLKGLVENIVNIRSEFRSSDLHLDILPRTYDIYKWYVRLRRSYSTSFTEIWTLYLASRLPSVFRFTLLNDMWVPAEFAIANESASPC
jgi:hypothetical protein